MLNTNIPLYLIFTSMTLAFALISILTNDERTRSFITAEVGAGYDKVSKMASARHMQAAIESTIPMCRVSSFLK